MTTYLIQTATQDYTVTEQELDRELEYYFCSEYNILNDDTGEMLDYIGEDYPTVIFKKENQQ